MNVLRKLSGVAIEEVPADLRFAVAMHEEPVKGFIRQAKIGPSGILLIAGPAQCLLPLEELFALAQAKDPNFAPPPVPAAKPSPGPRGAGA